MVPLTRRPVTHSRSIGFFFFAGLDGGGALIRPHTRARCKQASQKNTLGVCETSRSLVLILRQAKKDFGLCLVCVPIYALRPFISIQLKEATSAQSQSISGRC
jgi:hypothetical protein